MPMRGSTHDSWQQAHVDIGALAQRVTGLESAMGAVAEQIRDLSKKLDAKPTNWTGFWATVAAITAVVVGIGTAVITPINNGLSETSKDLKEVASIMVRRDDYLDNKRDMKDWATSMRDRLRFNEDNAVSQRQISELKDRFDERYRITAEAAKDRLARIEAHVDAIDAQLVKRPEIEAANHAQDAARESGERTLNDRTNSLTARMNSIQGDLNSISPVSKVIEELHNEIREVRTWLPKTTDK